MGIVPLYNAEGDILIAHHTIEEIMVVEDLA
jgi:hypothetical protein